MSLRIRDGPLGTPEATCPPIGRWVGGIPEMYNETRIAVAQDRNQTYNADALTQCCGLNPVKDVYSCYLVCKVDTGGQKLSGTDQATLDAIYKIQTNFEECLKDHHYGGKNDSLPYAVAVYPPSPLRSSGGQVKLGLVQAAIVGLALVSLTVM